MLTFTLQVETIGDAYMCVSGLPQRNEQHCQIIAFLAIAVMKMCETFKLRHRPDKKLFIRAGIHTGNVALNFCLFILTAMYLSFNIWYISEAILKIILYAVTLPMTTNIGR